MDIKVLRYFVTVVDTGSISAAAKKLHMSQPPLSSQIKLLESELGVMLMKRGSRNIVLTEAGEALYLRAKVMLEYMNTTLKELDNFCKGERGTLHVGTITSCSTILLSILADRYREKYPDIDFRLHEKHTYELLELLENNVIEVAVLRTPYKKTDSFKSAKIAKEVLMAVGGKEFLEETSEPLTVKQLEGKPLIIHRPWEAIVSNLFEMNHMHPHYYCISGDARTSLMWAISGMGIALIPTSVAFGIESKDMVYRQIDERSFDTEIYAVWKNVRHMSPALRNFIDVLETSH